MSTTIFKAGTKLANSTMGVGKLVMNIPGGVQTLTPLGYSSFTVMRKQEDNVFRTFRMKVYNGHLYTSYSDDYLEVYAPVSASAEVTTDEEGNTIRTYTILSDIGVTNPLPFRCEVGVTRVEVLDADDIEYAGIFANGDVPQTELEMNVEQFAYLPFNRINAYCAYKAYGDIKALKDKTGIVTLNARGSQITGDINYLAKSAYTLVGISAYQSKLYGNLNTLLETMKAAGVRNRTFELSIGESGITYNGSTPLGGLLFTFDANGDYTLTTT